VQVNWERYIFGALLFICLGVCCCHLDYISLENDTKEELVCYLKGCKRIVDEVLIHFFCVHLVMTKRHLIVVGWNPVMYR